MFCYDLVEQMSVWHLAASSVGASVKCEEQHLCAITGSTNIFLEPACREQSWMTGIPLRAGVSAQDLAAKAPSGQQLFSDLFLRQGL